MGELAQTPEAARKAPKLTLVERVMQGVEPVASEGADKIVLNRYAGAMAKVCYADERARIFSAAGAKTIEDFSEVLRTRADRDAQIAQLRAERDARVSPQEEAKHGRFRFYQGVAFGGALIGSLVAIGAAWYTTMIINPAFDAAGRIRAQSDITDALVRSQQEPQAEPYVNPGQDVTRRP